MWRGILSIYTVSGVFFPVHFAGSSGLARAGGEKEAEKAGEERKGKPLIN